MERGPHLYMLCSSIRVYHSFQHVKAGKLHCLRLCKNIWESGQHLCDTLSKMLLSSPEVTRGGHGQAVTYTSSLLSLVDRGKTEPHQQGKHPENVVVSTAVVAS